METLTRPTGGRRRNPNLQEVGVLLDRRDLVRLDSRAIEEGTSRSDLVRRAVRALVAEGDGE